MLEWILIIGLLFVLLITIVLHLLSTCSIEWLSELFEVNPEYADTSSHPWFFLIETILCLSIIYIFQSWLS